MSRETGLEVSVERVELGKTGLVVSVMGLGCGGASGLGKELGYGQAHSVCIVRRALELGVNFIDTAEMYGTEEIVGKAIAGVRREELVLATKKTTTGTERVTAKDLAASLEGSLRRLGTEYVDLYQLHCVTPRRYREVTEELVPEMERQRERGKIRFLGITEYFERDTRHEMLQEALREETWDAVMVGFNVLNPSARRTVFPVTRAKRVGTLIMFAVRRAMSRPEHLRTVVGGLIEQGKVDGKKVRVEDALGWLVHEGGATSVTDAAYRFCRHEAGAEVVLSGTSSIAHLEANAASVERGPLPAKDLARLKKLFGEVDTVSGG